MLQINSSRFGKDSLGISKLKNIFSFWKIKKYPSFSQWRQFLKILNKKERIIFFIFSAVFLTSSIYLLTGLYLDNTENQPASGGTFVEGVVGQPRFINPIYSSVSDVDQDLVELIFSGLLKYDENSEIVPDLAESYEIKDNGKIYEIFLKKNLVWSDGRPLTADDVIFTIKTIQNTEYKSPQIIIWVGVEVEKISDLAIRFSLKNPYNSFLGNLTQKIIPQHVWKDIDSQNFPLTIYNLKPVGSGPYKLKEIKQNDLGKITSLGLVKNQRYCGEIPYLSQISFRFFNNEEGLIKAAQKKEIQGLSILNVNNYQKLKDAGFQDFNLSLPRYFAVFFNPEKSEILADKDIRQALNYGTNKSEIVNEILLGYGKEVSSPVLPDIYGLSSPSKDYSFDIEAAKNLLDEADFLETENGLREKVNQKELAFQFKIDLKQGSTGKDVEALQQCLAKDPEIYPGGKVTGEFGSQTKQAVINFQQKYAEDILEPFDLKEGTGIVSKATRNKLNEICFPSAQKSIPLKFSLSTVDQPILAGVANLLKEQWKNLGAEVEIKLYNESEIKNIIKTRNYDCLLFGEVLGNIPDPFPFWYSLQKKDPGLNLAIYENKKADELLEEIRQTSDEEKRKQKLEEFQDILIADAPAVFLYNPDFVYFVSKEIKGISGGTIEDPSERFTNVENWYVKTSRCFNFQ